MTVHEINPLTDARWPEFVRNHPAASVFHTRGWLQALFCTYGYKPFALALCDRDDNLAAAIVFCEVSSWMTGRRLISLPFSDHCEPLANTEESRLLLMAALEKRGLEQGYKYVEVRPSSEWRTTPPHFKISRTFYLHRLDLLAGADEVYRRFHRDCVQRRIRRAERERLVVTEGNSPEHVEMLYQQVMRTRRRQGLPPQPASWYRNLAEYLGSDFTIRLAHTGDRCIAGIVTLQHRRTMVYKYGASDERFHNLGAIPLLYWQAIKDAMQRGLQEFDMGRTDCENAGLVAFKEHWGAARSEIQYWTSPPPGQQSAPHHSWYEHIGHKTCAWLPDPCLKAMGTLLYRHMA